MKSSKILAGLALVVLSALFTGCGDSDASAWAQINTPAYVNGTNPEPFMAFVKQFPKSVHAKAAQSIAGDIMVRGTMEGLRGSGLVR